MAAMESPRKLELHPLTLAPPGNEFVALGFVGTQSDKPPDVKSVRCVPRDWCKESGFMQKIWDDSGSSGRQGSIWVLNRFYLIEAV